MMLSQNLMKNVSTIAMIEVIVPHDEPKYLIRCYRCRYILKFAESDTIYDNDDSDYHLKCPVCGFTNLLGSKNNWDVKTKRLKGEFNV